MLSLTRSYYLDTHDVTWGTKADPLSPSYALPPPELVQKSSSKHETPLSSSDLITIDLSSSMETYLQNVKRLSVRPVLQRAHRDASTKREDFYKSTRTWFVLLWIISNALLVSVMTSNDITKFLTNNGNPTSTNPYMSLIMYSVAVFSIIRFIGAMIYLYKFYRS